MVADKLRGVAKMAGPKLDGLIEPISAPARLSYAHLSTHISQLLCKTYVGVAGMLFLAVSQSTDHLQMHVGRLSKTGLQRHNRDLPGKW